MWKLLCELFQELFNPPPPPQPSPANPPVRRATTPPEPPALPTPEQARRVRKAIEAMQLIDRSYALNLHTAGQAGWDDFTHDVTLMLANADLVGIHLRVYREGGAVIYQHAIEFGTTANPGAPNHSAGLELPVIAPAMISGSDLIVVRRSDHMARYKKMLKLTWTAATTRQLDHGATLATEHGRSMGHDARFTVTNRARVQLIVHRVGARGYAFAEDPNGHSVFVYAPTQQLRPGQTLSAILVQTPKGLQARAIQLA